MKFTREASLQGKENLKEAIGSLNTESGNLKSSDMNIKTDLRIVQGVTMKF